ncbi:hypothetical protein [Roseateles violae]|uniref:DUF4175 domain-containing protein n=1 Tax=Roseateles violae TaxID=3058042 RepID=A0ABT8DV43_9BURK|nr:hypothetical protein [Pelomonas sp. PFR6]MDN3922072.1 hypothetical protein [Pelomonas sp. PFR6]
MQARSNPATTADTAPQTATGARPFTAGLRLWAWPLALGVLSASGLLSALVSDHWGDVWSWFALGFPVLVMAWFGLRAPANKKR